MDRLNIRTKNRKFETAKDLYGIFFEDINRAGDGGIYPEMIRTDALKIHFFRRDIRSGQMEFML